MMNHPPVQVHLVAPALVCWGLQRLVQAAGGPFILNGWHSLLAEAMPQLERQLPDVLVLDFDDNYTVDDLQQLYDRVRVKVLALTSCLDPAMLSAILKSGARGILQKREAPSALLKALEIVGDGQIFASQTTTHHMFVAAAHGVSKARHEEDSRIATLTLRERQTIAAVTCDASAPVKVIADRLCISEHTLRNHLTSIYSKLEVSGRLGLYDYARQHQLNVPSCAVHGR